MIYVLTVIAGLVIGFLCHYFINKFALKAKCERIIEDAKKEAEVIKKNKLIRRILSPAFRQPSKTRTLTTTPR